MTKKKEKKAKLTTLEVIQRLKKESESLNAQMARPANVVLPGNEQMSFGGEQITSIRLFGDRCRINQRKVDRKTAEKVMAECFEHGSLPRLYV